ncbi:uncharacterized protein LOC118648335 [Monomorium pharaonis]|uniref:uncharacterized protein LOC118648335 n=1 Tax=Monomorium pharaonis TaxID=307658 RepID=UPI00174653AB|nr:uncharacterized protein LOC118648335 [Monomorium pharaonis]
MEKTGTSQSRLVRSFKPRRRKLSGLQRKGQEPSCKVHVHACRFQGIVIFGTTSPNENKKRKQITINNVTDTSLETLLLALLTNIEGRMTRSSRRRPRNERRYNRHFLMPTGLGRC